MSITPEYQTIASGRKLVVCHLYYSSPPTIAIQLLSLALAIATTLLYKPRPPFLLLPLSFFSLTYLLSLLSRLLNTLHYYIQFLITFLRHYHNASPTHHLPRLHHGIGWSHRHIVIPHHQHRRLRHASPLAVHAASGFCPGHGIVQGDFAPARGCLHVRRNGIPAGSGERERRSNFPPRSRTLSLRSTAKIG
jgi:hypothetical protein